MREAMLDRMPPAIVMVLVALSVRAGSGAAEEVRVADRGALARALDEARPGTTILVAAGTYAGGLHVASLRGSADEPIVVAGADPENPPLFEGGASALHLSDAAHVELRDLAFAGTTANGLNIDDGGSYATPSHHVVLRRLTVRRVGPDGNRDGIKLSGVDDFLVEDCVVERWGAGGSGLDMVGCHRGLISGCTFRHDEPSGANGVQTKGGSREITVRRCRFERAGGRGVNVGGSTGLEYFRPRPEGFEAKDITVEDCTFVGSQAPIAFVGVDGAVVRHNTFYRPGRWALRILQETRGADFVPSRGGKFTKNIVAYRADELREVVNIGPDTEPGSFEFAGNFWYCLDRPDQSARVERSLPGKEREGTYGVDPRFVDPEKGNLTLQAQSPARAAGPRAP